MIATGEACLGFRRSVKGESWRTRGSENCNPDAKNSPFITQILEEKHSSKQYNKKEKKKKGFNPPPLISILFFFLFLLEFLILS